jgi:hypothetical protein
LLFFYCSCARLSWTSLPASQSQRQKLFFFAVVRPLSSFFLCSADSAQVGVRKSLLGSVPTRVPGAQSHLQFVRSWVCTPASSLVAGACLSTTALRSVRAARLCVFSFTRFSCCSVQFDRQWSAPRFPAPECTRRSSVLPRQ